MVKALQHLLSVVYTVMVGDAHACTSGWIERKDWSKDTTLL